MKTFFASLALLANTLLAPAFAAEIADLNVRGFSQDGRIFAFEERGIQDGSGAPYANIFLVDTDEDRFLPGTPIRRGREGEFSSVWQAILAARNDLSDRGISLENYVSGNVVASFAPAQIKVNKKQASFYLIPNTIGLAPTYRVEIREFPLDGPQYCQDFGIDTVGFELKFGREDDDELRVVHSDTRLPGSRGCVVGYDVREVRTHLPDGRGVVVAIVIFMQGVGFENSLQGRHMVVIPH
jgi:predicted secreted protein